MIFFYCPSCDEELEAEDSVKGTRMKCPACLKEIVVPLVGVKVQQRNRAMARPAARDPVGPKLLVAGILLVLLSGVAFVIVRTVIKSKPEDRPKCAACGGKATQVCTECKGAKTFPCKGECKGTGKVIHVGSGQQTNCSDCGGSGKQHCPVCDGRGFYACQKCGGSGYLKP